MPDETKPDLQPPPATAGLRLLAVRQRAGELPGVLRNATRAADAALEPLLAGLTVEATYALPGATRDATATTAQAIEAGDQRVLALEAEDGTTIFVHAERLRADIERLCPEAIVDGELDLSRFVDRNAAQRGFFEVVWKMVSVLRLPADGLAEEAMSLARDWAIDQLSHTLTEKLPDKAFGVASFLGAKALMWTIESRLAGRPGLYHWQKQTIGADDFCPPGDPRLAEAGAGKRMLLFIHGTGSYTMGAFSDLLADENTWNDLQARFPGGVFGYEHRSFSQSPVENALELLQALPEGARLALVTHSRGGLVGDLLCLGQVDEAALEAYQMASASMLLAPADDAMGLQRELAEERARLRRIVQLIGERRITVERYVRVACPARGTRFLSDNLEVALSDFLNLLQWGGGALLSAVGSALGGPAAGQAAGRLASSALAVVKRLVLEIAGRRIDPRMIPGIAAMRVDSPLAAFLAHPATRRRDGIALAVIAGDTEFSGFGLGQLGRRVANLFCDWRLFDRHDNDLVVDTDSMYAGLAARAGARYLYHQGEAVSHFRYFANSLTRLALHGWLTGDPASQPEFQPLDDAPRQPWGEREAGRTRAVGSQARPAIVVLPGIMGSHIAVRDGKGKLDRIWFNLLRLGLGQLERIADENDPGICPEDIWERFYGDLADFLAGTHEVIRHPYDWRLPIEQSLEQLDQVIRQRLENQPGQPLRLLAHSMGGLVARAWMKKFPQTWSDVLKSGGRLLMLGTPNRGAHLMVHTLLGKTSAMRGLATLDGKHDLQEILDIVAGFPGALSLLPRPSASGAAAPGEPDYYSAQTWEALKGRNRDRWFGGQIGARPQQAMLDRARSVWDALLADDKVAEPVERIAYVFGQGEQTPCGLAQADGRLQLLFTSEGDGSVTWQSGRLDNLPEGERCWYMPVEHSDLTGTAEYFPAILDLLTSGSTSRLDRLPRTRGAAVQPVVLEAPPPVVPGEEELARAIFGSGPRRRVRARKATLAVNVVAGDLRFIDQPLLCGHFVGDPLAAAEADLDERLEGRLSERQRLGVYAGPIGTSAIVLSPPSASQAARGSRPGAVIVGLGDFNGQLSARQISETVRAAVLRLLLLLRDSRALGVDAPVRLYSLLLGCNSVAQISIADSVAAVTCGVLEANRQLAQAQAMTAEPGAPVSSLTFIDLYRDVATSAAHAVSELPQAIESQLRALEARLEPARSLSIGQGARDRLSAEQGWGYWSRLIITDADAPEVNCPPECYDVEPRSPLPPELRRRLLAGCPGQHAAGQQPAADEAPPAPPYLPERLKYVFLSQRARAETLVQQRQPGLVEALVRQQRLNNRNNPRLARTLFQLMLPIDYKAAARAGSRLLLVLDSYTASLPWELLQADDQPLAVRAPMIRQLITARFRGAVPTANTRSACVIVAPSTLGFKNRFPGVLDELERLPGAIAEGNAVRAILSQAGWQVAFCGEGKDAGDVLAHLYDQPYRLLTVCAHGIFELPGRDGRRYTGVVLSDGSLITAVEIGLMEVVPEVVFLSCCHVGSMTHESQPNRLAYSLARELIDIGVRCVIAAGWAVDDQAAKTFATTFFAELTAGRAYGEAVFAARRETYEKHAASNTWGAYQAYGDPGYRLGPDSSGRQRQDRPLVAVEELIACIDGRRLGRPAQAGRRSPPTFADEQRWLQQQFARCPPEWSTRPEVQQTVAALYADLGESGFAAAHAAYLAALQNEDEAGRIACRAVEQLANLEARQGEKLADSGRLAEGKQLIDTAIARLEALNRAVDQSPAARNSANMGNAERNALLGSALKRRACALAAADSPWSEVAQALRKAADAYLATSRGQPPHSQPYHTLNALPLHWLAGKLAERDRARAVDVARQCGAQASQRFAASKDFWDAVGRPDAAVVEWLLGDDPTDPGTALENAYRQLAREVPYSGRQWDSVARQLRLLASLLRRRQAAADGAPLADPSAAVEAAGRRDDAQRADAQRAEVLTQLAERLAGFASPSSAPSGAAASKETP